MGKYIFFLFFVDFGLHGIYSKDLKDEDIFITNTTSTYEDIPKDCKLVGAEFDQDYPTNSTRLNITDDGSFWIGATIGFKRNINPIGIKQECPKSKEDISLDKCNHQCQSYKYFNQGTTSCNCDINNETDGILLNTESCEKEDKLLCQQKVCVVYRRVSHQDDYVCGTYRYVKVKDVVSNWLFKQESCFEKRNFRFICTRGNTTMNYSSSMLTWYEAYQRCKDDGQDLLQHSNGKYVKNYKDGRTYWVSLFRRTQISWGKAHGKSLCVAAFVSNGTLLLVSKLCSDDLPALCYSNQNDGDKTKNNGILCVAALLINGRLSLVSKLCTEELRSLCIASGHSISTGLSLLAISVGICCSGVLCLIAVSFVCAKCYRKKTQSIQLYETPLNVINSHIYEEPHNDETYQNID